MIHTFKVYTHDESDEEAAEYAADAVGADSGPAYEGALSFLENNPFYEVAFEIEYDDETKEHRVVSCQPSRGGSWKLVSA